MPWSGDWWRARNTNSPRLVECPAKRVPEVLRAAKTDGIDLVVVDTRPSVEADTVEIARLSDMVLIPTKPGILDLRAIAPTTDVVRAVKLPKAATIIVLNGVPAARGFGENGLTAEARRALHAYRLPIADVSIGNRTAFAHALIGRRTVTDPRA